MNTWTLTTVLAGLAMIGPFAIDTFLPSFPAIAQQFSVSPAMVQQALSAYLLAFSAMSLLYGTLSDSFGRRPVILVSLALFSAASLGAALAAGFGWLLTCRVLQGLSAGGGMVIGQAIVRDRFAGAAAQRVLSHVTMVFGLAPALAPVIGGYLHVTFGWRSVFLFMAAIGLALLAASAALLTESLPRDARVPFQPRTLAGRYWAALRRPRFLPRALAVGFAFGGLGLYIASAASFVLRILHLSETAFAWLFVPMIGGMVTGAAIGARLAHRVPAATVLRAGRAGMATAALTNLAYGALATPAVPWAVLPIMLYTVGLGLALPGMSLAALDLLPQARGLAASLLTFVQMLIFSVISGVVAPLLFDSALKLAIGVLACATLSAGCWAWPAAERARSLDMAA